jgi:hypothetical protein
LIRDHFHPVKPPHSSIRHDHNAASRYYVRESGFFQKKRRFFARAGKLDVVTCRFGSAGFWDSAHHLNNEGDFIGVL